MEMDCVSTLVKTDIDIWERICIQFLKYFVKVHIFWEGYKILQNLHLIFDYSTYSQFSLNVHGHLDEPSNALLRILRKWRHILPHMSRSVFDRCGKDWPNHSSWAWIRGMNDGTAKSNPLWSAWESLLSFDARCFVRVHDERPWCQYVMVTMCSGPVDHMGTDGIIYLFLKHYWDLNTQPNEPEKF